VIPGLGDIAGTLSGLSMTVADGVGNVYDDYQNAKSKNQKYGFIDGVKSFVRPGAMNTLTKSFDSLHPRIKLKDSGEEEE
jgi:hypothetical protein